MKVLNLLGSMLLWPGRSSSVMLNEEARRIRRHSRYDPHRSRERVNEAILDAHTGESMSIVLCLRSDSISGIECPRSDLPIVSSRDQDLLVIGLLSLVGARCPANVIDLKDIVSIVNVS